MLANVWVLPALISFTPIFLGWYTTAEHLAALKINPDLCIFVVNKSYAIISSSISFWIPGIVMVTMYYRIYKWVDRLLHTFYRSSPRSVLCREAVRQRKALSRTSSNILLNSVQINNASNTLHANHHHHNHHHQHLHHRNHHLRASDCDLGIDIKDIQHDTHSELSDLDVSTSWVCNPLASRLPSRPLPCRVLIRVFWDAGLLFGRAANVLWLINCQIIAPHTVPVWRGRMLSVWRLLPIAKELKGVNCTTNGVSRQAPASGWEEG